MVTCCETKNKTKAWGLLDKVSGKVLPVAFDNRNDARTNKVPTFKVIRVEVVEIT